MFKEKKVKALFDDVLNCAVTGKESKLEATFSPGLAPNFAAVSATGAVLWACGKKDNNSDAAPGCQVASLTGSAQNFGSRAAERGASAGKRGD